MAIFFFRLNHSSGFFYRIPKSCYPTCTEKKNSCFLNLSYGFLSSINHLKIKKNPISLSEAMVFGWLIGFFLSFFLGGGCLIWLVGWLVGWFNSTDVLDFLQYIYIKLREWGFLNLNELANNKMNHVRHIYCTFSESKSQRLGIEEINERISAGHRGLQTRPLRVSTRNG